MYVCIFCIAICIIIVYYVFAYPGLRLKKKSTQLNIRVFRYCEEVPKTGRARILTKNEFGGLKIQKEMLILLKK